MADFVHLLLLNETVTETEFERGLLKWHAATDDDAKRQLGQATWAALNARPPEYPTDPEALPQWCQQPATDSDLKPIWRLLAIPDVAASTLGKLARKALSNHHGETCGQCYIIQKALLSVAKQAIARRMGIPLALSPYLQQTQLLPDPEPAPA